MPRATERRNPNPGAKCGHAKSGRSDAGEGPCGKSAGAGTDHLGWGWCALHGGNSPTGKKYASKLQADAAKARVMLGAPSDVTPGEAIEMAMRATQGHVEWLQRRISEAASLDELSGPILTMYAEERKTLLALAKSALDAGVAERHVRLAEAQGELMHRVFLAVLESPALGLTAVQRVRAVPVIRAELSRVLEVDSSEPPAPGDDDIGEAEVVVM